MAGQTDPDFSVFSAAEMEFLAEDEMIEIVPNMRMEKLTLISGDYGPFLPRIATEVPLWLAVALKKRGKCSVLPPRWMSVERLTQVLEAERDSPKEFQQLPFHYVEISRLLFDHARDDIPDIYMVRSLIEDIRNVRFHKVESGLETISGRTHAVKLKNLSAMEVNIVRPFVVRTLQAFYKHDSPEMIQQPVQMSGRRPQVAADRGARRELRRGERRNTFMRMLQCILLPRKVSQSRLWMTIDCAGINHSSWRLQGKCAILRNYCPVAVSIDSFTDYASP